mgnify:CR=1 FL=1
MSESLMVAGGLVSDEDLDAATAVADNVLSGKTFLAGGNSDLQTGSMPEKGAWNGSVAMNGSIAIPAGHHNGSGKVSGPKITDRGAWNDTVAMNTWITVPEGYHNGKGWVYGPKITDRGAWNDTVAMNSTVTVPKGYHNGSGKVSGPKITDNGTWTNTIAPGKWVYIPQGYHNGSGWVQAKECKKKDIAATASADGHSSGTLSATASANIGGLGTIVGVTASLTGTDIYNQNISNSRDNTDHVYVDPVSISGNTASVKVSWVCGYYEGHYWKGTAKITFTVFYY